MDILVAAHSKAQKSALGRECSKFRRCIDLPRLMASVALDSTELRSGESATQSAHINASSDFYCDSHTGGSCRFWSCSESRGPTMCRSNECRCKPGYCARDGACTKRTAHIADTCNRQTGGSCSVFGCYSYRGPVQCADGACVCKAGYCTADDGTCHQPKPPISARVAPVHFDAPQFPGPQAGWEAIQTWPRKSNLPPSSAHPICILFGPSLAPLNHNRATLYKLSACHVRS